MVLVVSATLFLGTLVKLYGVDRGFEADGLYVVAVRHSRPYPAERTLPVHEAVIERLRALPAPRSVSAAQMLPVAGSLWTRQIQVEGYTFRADEDESVAFNAVAPGYFATLGTPLVSGREFTDRDTAAAPMVAIVNESFARHFFADASPLGRHVTSVGITYQIVGVARDAKYQSLRDAAMTTMYIASRQRQGEQPSNYNYLLRLSGGMPAGVASMLDRAVRDADPALQVRSVRPYAAIIERELATERIMATLGGVFGVLALVIAALGVFGVLAFQVARRTNELGVRTALGATRWSLTRLVLRDVAWMVAAGVFLGGGAALFVSSLARTFVFGFTETDWRIFAVAASLLATAAAIGAWVPAHRASRVDPLHALRHE